MTIKLDDSTSIKFEPNEKGNPVGQLATAELHFTSGLLAGLKLIGFGIWERRGGNGRNLVFPARQYAVNGERRSFALLRPMDTIGLDAQLVLRERILAAFVEFEELSSADPTAQ